MKRNRPWTEEDRCLVVMYYKSEPVADLAEVLGRSANAIGQQAGKLGIYKGRFLSKREIAIIRKRFPHERTDVIAAAIGRSYSSVAQYAHTAGLKKTPEYMKTVGFEKGTQIGAPYQFKKRHISPTKGVRRPGYAPGRMAETQFKKGQRSGAASNNFKPVGTIRKDADGLLLIKVYNNPRYVKNENIVGDGRPWEYLHRRVWRQKKGPIPPRTHVAFIDGNHDNVDITNLELVSFEEMARRNSMWATMPRELAEVLNLAGALKRRIRRAQRGQK